MKWCKKHPKYKGKRMPQGCAECLAIYITVNNSKIRRPHKPTKVMADKTKYSRKKKHKDKEY